MNLDSLSFALAEISYSVANLTKKNFKSSVAEISHVSMFLNIYLDFFDTLVICAKFTLGEQRKTILHGLM